mmetsp:Transcript_63632/g.121226  ORF Transcript_63632/g.121226 Transcript_63632/m.121226 type:complete len:266 (+) Transcript_63632:772-1569(+)
MQLHQHQLPRQPARVPRRVRIPTRALQQRLPRRHAVSPWKAPVSVVRPQPPLPQQQPARTPQQPQPLQPAELPQQRRHLLLPEGARPQQQQPQQRPLVASRYIFFWGWRPLLLQPQPQLRPKMLQVLFDGAFLLLQKRPESCEAISFASNSPSRLFATPFRQEPGFSNQQTVMVNYRRRQHPQRLRPLRQSPGHPDRPLPLLQCPELKVWRASPEKCHLHLPRFRSVAMAWCASIAGCCATPAPLPQHLQLPQLPLQRQSMSRHC